MTRSSVLLSLALLVASGTEAVRHGLVRPVPAEAAVAGATLASQTRLPTPDDPDGDGVPTWRDLCPNTAPGVRVDDVGCPVGGWGAGTILLALTLSLAAVIGGLLLLRWHRRREWVEEDPIGAGEAEPGIALRSEVAEGESSPGLLGYEVPHEWLRPPSMRLHPVLLAIALLVLGGAVVVLARPNPGERLPELPAHAAQDDDTATGADEGSTTGESPAGASSPPDAADSEEDQPPAERVGPPTRLLRFSGDGQTAPPGQGVPAPVAVRALDAAGNPVPGVVVTFQVASGQGRVTPQAAVTNAGGIAEAEWTLGSEEGPQEVEAVLPGAGTQRFRATAGALALEEDPAPSEPATGEDALPTSLRLAVVEGDQQEAPPGEALRRPVTLRVEGGDGTPVAGARVEFLVTAGGGQPANSAATSASDGTVRLDWLLGPEPGPNQIVAALADDPETRITVRAAAVAPEEPAPRRVVASRRVLAAGGTHTCGVSETGQLRCWGGNENGQLGVPGSARSSPGVVPGELSFATVAAGIGFTCAVDVSGRAHCWGANDAGQLGDGSGNARARPAPVAGDVALTTVAAGSSHACGLAADGTAHCWGGNVYGQLGDGTQEDRTGAARVVGGRSFRAIAVGWTHTCALAEPGRAFCWGRNAFGQLGEGSGTDRVVPTIVAGGLTFVRISAGSAHTCALTAAGIVYCWGQNSSGQLGDGTMVNRPTPAAAAGDLVFQSLAAGGVHTCGLTRQGRAYCWGRNTYGQVGDGTTQDRTRPVPVAGDHTFTAIYASGAHTCGTTTAGEDYCWGYNVSGQLGDGTRTNRSEPVRVGGGAGN